MAERKEPEPATVKVTDQDVSAFWDALYTRPGYPAVPPRQNDYYDQLLLEGIRRGMEGDRKRVAARQSRA